MSLPNLAGALLGPPHSLVKHLVNSGNTSTAMATLNTVVAFRFKARSTADIKSVIVQWGTVTLGSGVVRLSIEAIDATTGKPPASYTPYDANAAIASVTVATGVQTYTFATLPTTGLTVGAEYAVILETTTGGTTLPLFTGQSYAEMLTVPALVLTGSSRAAWAEVLTLPTVAVIDENDTYLVELFHPFQNTPVLTGRYLFSTTMLSAKFTLDAPVICSGVKFIPKKNGTPTADLRVRLCDRNNNQISGADVSLDKDSLSGAEAGVRGAVAQFPTAITLAAGTYRAVFSAAADANSSNAHYLQTIAPLTSACYGADQPVVATGTSGGADALPTSWADGSDAFPCWLLLDNLTTSSGGGVFTCNQLGMGII